MLKSYPATYAQGQLHWLDQAPPSDTQLSVMVVVEVPNLELTATFPEPESGQAAEEYDPTLNAFLSFLDREMAAHPERIQPMDEEQLRRIAELVKGVEID